MRISEWNYIDVCGRSNSVSDMYSIRKISFQACAMGEIRFQICAKLSLRRAQWIELGFKHALEINFIGINAQ